MIPSYREAEVKCAREEKTKARRWAPAGAQLIFTINGCHLSKQHSRHCSFLPQKSSALLPPPPPSNPPDDVNARRHNDESQAKKSNCWRWCSGGLCYLPNRMKKRVPSGPSSRKWGDTVRSKSSSPSSPSAPLHLVLIQAAAYLQRTVLGREGDAKGKTGLLYGAARNAPNKYRSFTNCPRLIAPPNRPL